MNTIKRNLENASDVFKSIAEKDFFIEKLNFMFIETIVNSDLDKKQKCDLNLARSGIIELIQNQ